MTYVGAAGGAAVANATWQPGSPNVGVKTYQAAVTRVFVGVFVDFLAEFAPDFKRLIHKDKNKKGTSDQQ